MPDAVATAGIAFMTVVAAALAAVTAIAWRRDRRPRFALLAIAFALFLLKGAYLTWGIWTGLGATALLAAASVADAAFLGLVYLALARR